MRSFHVSEPLSHPAMLLQLATPDSSLSQLFPPSQPGPSFIKAVFGHCIIHTHTHTHTRPPTLSTVFHFWAAISQGETQQANLQISGLRTMPKVRASGLGGPQLQPHPVLGQKHSCHTHTDAYVQPPQGWKVAALGTCLPRVYTAVK